ncbi:hypothetical protein P4133_25655 [Pseudomonas aeruginosa]|nr:hypothetical protein [Pseudomonas aeruginosa]
MSGYAAGEGMNTQTTTKGQAIKSQAVDSKEIQLGFYALTVKS